MRLRCVKNTTERANYGALWVFEDSSVTINNMDIIVTESIQQEQSESALGIICTKGSIRIGENCTMQLNGFPSGSSVKGMYLYSNGGISLDRDFVINGVCNTVCVVSDLSVWSRTSSNPVITGSVTGKRYSVGNYSTINTRGGGANYFPGDVAGTTSNGLYS
jgi:hypothetical protein